MAKLFSVYDFIVFFGTLALSLLIGVYFGWKNRNKNSVENYFLADRKLAVIPTALSLVITFQSSLLIIGVPPEVYSYGFKYVYYVLGPLASFTFAGLVIAPVFHPLKLTSVNKYFKLRYNDNTVRYLVMSLGIFYYVQYSGGVIFGTCVALEFLMNIPYWGTICIYSTVTAIYTSVGGMTAVIWTDVLQITIMAMGVFAIIIKSGLEVGGMSTMFDLAANRLDMNDFRLDPTIRYQFWNLAVGAFMSFLVSSFQQPGIQRINSTPTVVTARRLCVISGIVFALLSACVCFEGVAIFAFYSSRGCDPLASGRIESTNEIIPLAVSDLFLSIPGLSGLFIAALSSAALSTLSSNLSSLGAVTYDDIIKERYPNISEKKATTISKIVVFLYGMIAMGFTAIISVLPGSILNVTYALMGCVDGPTCALFVISMLYRKATTKGLVTGAIAGIACILWLIIGNMTADRLLSTPTLPPAPSYCCLNATSEVANISSSCIHNDGFISNINVSKTIYSPVNDTDVEVTTLQAIYSISFMIYAWVGFIITFIVALIVSLFTSPPNTFDERCLLNFKKHILDELFPKQPIKTVLYADDDEMDEDSEEKDRLCECDL